MSLSKFDLWLRGFSPTAIYEGEDMTASDELPPDGMTSEELADAIRDENENIRADYSKLLDEIAELRKETARLLAALEDRNKRFFDAAWEDGKLTCAKCKRQVDLVYAHRGQAWCRDCVAGDQA